MSDKDKITILTQAQILRDLGLDPKTPDAPARAAKIADDHLVLDRAMKLLLAEKVPQVLAEMTPIEKARLVKRTGPAPQPTIRVEWSVLRTEISQEWHVRALGIRSFGNAQTVIGDANFTGTPEGAKTFRAFGETCPAEIVSEYARYYTGGFVSDSAQSKVFADLSAPTYDQFKQPDFSHCPGPRFAGVSK